MKKIITIFFLFTLTSNAQNIYSAEYKSQADINIFVVDYKSQADLLIYKVDYKSQAKGNEGLWFFVDYKSQADLKVFFVDYKSQAGWVSKEKKHLLY